jgi:rod shape determining protein RodA
MRPTSGTISALTGSLPLAEERASLRHLTGLRWGLLAAALLLTAVGLLTVASASAEMPASYLPRQAMWVGVGLLLLLVAFAVDYRMLLSLSLPLYLASLAALAAVLVVGHEAGGAKSWLGVGGWRLQPSEFAKLATALLLARYLATTKERFLRTRQIALATLIALVPMALVVVEPDLGGAAMFLPLLAGVLLVAGVRLRLLAAALLALALVGGLVWSFGMQDYQRDRVITFLQPERDPLGAGYQVRQSKIAVGSGEFLGKGYLQGTQSQLRFLPARHTDFIFAVLAEEWGFVGVAVVLGLYALFLLNGAEVAMRGRDRAGILLVVALLSSTAFHVLYNTAMVVGLVPITGIPLPFLSYGGSFMLANFLSLGILLGVDFRRFVNR